MNIGVLTGEMFTNQHYGGFGFVARASARLLADKGHHLILLNHGELNEHSDEGTLDGHQVIYLRNKKRGFKWIGEYRATQNYLLAANIDAIISVEPSRWTYYFQRADPSIKHVVWFQDVRLKSDWQLIDTNPTTRLKRGFITKWRLEQQLRRWACHRADLLLTQAWFVAEKAHSLYQIPLNQVQVVPNPIPIPFQPQHDPDDAHVVFLGRLDPIKRPWIFAALAKKFPTIQFTCMGITHFPEVINPMLDFEATPNLEYVGHVEGHAKHELLQNAVALLNTSIYESLPVSFLEALSYRIPIVSNRDPMGFTSFFGRHIPHADGDGWHSLPEFTLALDYVLNDPADCYRSRMNAGYDFVRRFCDENVIQHQLDYHLTNLMD